MRMFALGNGQIEHTWDDYRGLFERFERATGDFTAEQIRDEAIEGTMQIWGLQDDEQVRGVLTTQIIETARGKVCLIAAAVGDAPIGFQRRLLDEIGKWAREEQGCVAVRLQGRKGWLRRFGCFRQTGIIAEWNLRAN